MVHCGISVKYIVWFVRLSDVFNLMPAVPRVNNTCHDEQSRCCWPAASTSPSRCPPVSPACVFSSTASVTPRDNVIKWKHFPRYWPFVRGIHRSPVNSPHKDQWRGALMFSLICTRINGWVNNGEAGDLSRYRAHYDITVMYMLNSIRPSHRPRPQFPHQHHRRGRTKPSSACQVPS